MKSSIETFVTGTLVAKPINFPFSSGMIFPMAEAAPVLVGINDSKKSVLCMDQSDNYQEHFDHL